jgi:hypothetical protein
MNRKEFFKESGRWVILSGIGLITTLLALDHKIVRAEECSESVQCKNCGKQKKCSLPKAKQQLNGK